MKFSLTMRMLLVLLFVCADVHAAQVEIVVSAAASLKDVLTVIGHDYQKQRRNVRVRFNFGSSGTLQRQIEQGAPVDLFIAAADRNIDELAARNLVDKRTRRVIAENSLVLIVPRQSRLPIRGFKDVLSPTISHVAVGAPSVPAGMRAQEVFARLGIWPQVQRKAVRGKDVREVLTQVELGNAEAGIVYRTDALASTKVRIVATAPTSMHRPIRYPLAVVSDSRHAAKAREFATYLIGPRAKAILRRYRFIVR